MQVATVYANIGNMGDDEGLNEEIAATYKEILESKFAVEFVEKGWTVEVELVNACGASKDPSLFCNSPEDEKAILAVLPHMESESFEEAIQMGVAA